MSERELRYFKYGREYIPTSMASDDTCYLLTLTGDQIEILSNILNYAHNRVAWIDEVYGADRYYMPDDETWDTIEEIVDDLEYRLMSKCDYVTLDDANERVTVSGQVVAQAGADATVPLVAKGKSATQTGNLHEWRTYADVVQAFMSKEGSLILDPAGAFGYSGVTMALAVARAFNTSSSVSGITSVIQQSGTGNTYGLSLIARIRGSSNISLVAAAGFGVATHPSSSGSIINGYGLLVDSPTLAGSGAIQNIYGIRISAQAGGSVSTHALHTAAGKVHLGDDVDIVGKFGCNAAAPQAAATVNAACTDLDTAIALVNQLRTVLVANGICV